MSRVASGGAATKLASGTPGRSATLGTQATPASSSRRGFNAHSSPV